jgi:hypothetical protein
MQTRDPHKSLKTEIIAQNSSRSCNFALAKLQWGEDDFKYSLHANPNTFSLSGYQITDFLSQIGFQRSVCSFFPGGCYVKWVEQDFDLSKFTPFFESSYNKLVESQKELGACGFFFDQPEGWGYFTRKSQPGRSYQSNYYGDGHTVTKTTKLKESEDDIFKFKFTFIEDDGDDKGWVIHYKVKHLGKSSELVSVFNFLGIKAFDQCPEFDFDSCSWRFIEFVSRGYDDDGNVNSAHTWFDAHKSNFSKGIQKLLEANADIEKTGLTFLPFEKSEKRLSNDIIKRVSTPKDQKIKIDGIDFDVAISFAGTERTYAEELANSLKKLGYSVFYDDFYPEDLWGKDLTATFDKIYRKQSRYCVMFISNEYKNRLWTTHERRSALARNLQGGGEDYILPIKIDNTDIDGLPPTIGYLSMEKGIEYISDILDKKIKKNKK